jgi:hypothetical protein
MGAAPLREPGTKQQRGQHEALIIHGRAYPAYAQA